MALFTTALGLYGGVLWSGELQGFIIHQMMPSPIRRPNPVRCKGGAELPLPALRRQAPRWARGWVGDPGARSRTPPTSAPFAKKVGSKT